MGAKKPYKFIYCFFLLMALSHWEKIKLHSFLVCLNMQGNLKEIFFCRTLVMYKSPRFLVESSFYRWRNLCLRGVSCPTTGQTEEVAASELEWISKKHTSHPFHFTLLPATSLPFKFFFFWYLVNLSKKFTLCHLNRRLET